jgi:hypothetical protein
MEIQISQLEKKMMDEKQPRKKRELFLLIQEKRRNI